MMSNKEDAFNALLSVSGILHKRFKWIDYSETRPANGSIIEVCIQKSSGYITMMVGAYVEHGSIMVINHYGISEFRPLTIYGNQAESDVTIHWRPYYKPGTEMDVDEKDYGS